MLIARDPITGPSHAATTCRGVLAERALLLVLCLRSRAALAAESLFLRKQLALFEERKAQPHRATDAVRFVMSAPGRLFDWHHALRVIKPDTFIRRASQRISIVLGGRSRPLGRPKLPSHLRELIRTKAAEDPIWGEARIADELRHYKHRRPDSSLGPGIPAPLTAAPAASRRRSA